MGEFICGNIRETNLTKIYTNSSILRMFKELTVEDIEVCNKCDLKYLCAGGCRATAYKLYNDIKAYNERFCKMYRMATIDILEGMSYPYKIFKAH